MRLLHSEESNSQFPDLPAFLENIPAVPEEWPKDAVRKLDEARRHAIILQSAFHCPNEVKARTGDIWSLRSHGVTDYRWSTPYAALRAVRIPTSRHGLMKPWRKNWLLALFLAGKMSRVQRDAENSALQPWTHLPGAVDYVVMLLASGRTSLKKQHAGHNPIIKRHDVPALRRRSCHLRGTLGEFRKCSANRAQAVRGSRSSWIPGEPVLFLFVNHQGRCRFWQTVWLITSCIWSRLKNFPFNQSRWSLKLLYPAHTIPIGILRYFPRNMSAIVSFKCSIYRNKGFYG